MDLKSIEILMYRKYKKTSKKILVFFWPPILVTNLLKYDLICKNKERVSIQEEGKIFFYEGND